MAVEKRRGCGFRKVGGTYLVSEGQGVPCDRLPIRLDVCPVCSHGFKQTRGFTWVDLFGLVGGNHLEESAHTMNATATGPLMVECGDEPWCPLCHHVKAIGKAGLLWIGEKFYPKPEDFMREGQDMGFSRRVSAIPRNFKVGETWVMLAHPKTISEWRELPADPDREQATLENVEKEQVWVPGIFTLWRPTRIEKLFKESDRESDDVKKAVEQGITPVFVPDDDKDHMGTVYDKEEDTEEIAAT